MDKPDSTEFQARLAAGDPDVENDIFAEHWPAMYSAALGVFGSPTRQVRSKGAEDAVQAACLEVHQKGLLDKNVKNIGGLLVTITTRRALDMVKKQKATVEGIDDLEGMAGESIEAEDEFDDVVTRVAAEQVRLAAIDVAANFSGNEQKVFHAYFRVGKSVPEVANDLTLSEPGVRKIIDRIIAKLQKDLGIRPGR